MGETTQKNSQHGHVTMEWLPTISEFRTRLQAAIEAGPLAERLGKLAHLAQHQLSYVETIQLDRALGRSGAESAEGFSTVRLAILASSTVEHLAPAIRVAGLRRRLVIDVHSGAYGQHRQQLLDPESSLYKFAPQIVCFSLSARDVIGSVPLTATTNEVDAVIGQSVNDIRFLWKRAREAFKATVVQQTFLDITDPLFGSYDQLVPAAPSRMVARINKLIIDAAVSDGVLILDATRVSRTSGMTAWFDVGYWMRAKMEIAPTAVTMYGELVARIIAAQRGLSKKCLVLDLDNTLWSGVIGDDGLDGIVLGEGSALGEAHLALQHYILKLKARGVILAVCSKNDQSIAEAVFRDHPEMALQLSDFAVFIANWDDKAANLRVIAAQLNIGLDSLVFLDDNPVERLRVREALPMVAVPELPDDVVQYVSCLANAGYFEAVSFTRDDQLRAEQYSANRERVALQGSLGSMEEFLRDLGMSVVFDRFDAVDISRVAQLIGKTNQFNPTTRRYSAEEIQATCLEQGIIALKFRLLDRFGDNGIVSALILRPRPEQGDVLEIDTWVMSCRVFGRELEYEIMNIAVEIARSKGVNVFRATYIPSSKNVVIKDLYLSLGFTCLNTDTHQVDGATQWRLQLSEYVGRKTQINRIGNAE